ITVVDTTGIHIWNITYCNCPDAGAIHFQLFSASITNPRTVFTFRVLDDFLRDNVECGTSTMNYFSKLHHITSSAFPHLVVDRYRELMRVARQWRLLKTLKWNGYGIGDDSPGQGELALFCPACPQPGINVPVEPGNDFTHWKYTRTIIMDGNFKAEHMHCSSPEDDVYLMDG
ncbi:hypothetical protein BU15DRAFT_56673, partial [Melanogaster broomeanus]